MYVKAHDNVCLVLYKTKTPEHSEDAGQDLGTALLLRGMPHPGALTYTRYNCLLQHEISLQNLSEGNLTVLQL
jgi:hypothetical protein